MSKENGSKFGFGLLIGAAIGGIAALFLSPKSGKENRTLVKKKWEEFMSYIDDAEIEKKVNQIYGDVSEETKRIYLAVQKESKLRMKEMRSALDEVDIEGYKKMVANVIDQVKKETGVTSEMVQKSKDYLLSFIQQREEESEEEKKPKAPARKTAAKKSDE